MEKKYIIAYIDRFSRFSILDSLKDRTAVTVADSLFQRVNSTFNGVKTLISDNAAELNGQILKELCKKFDIKKCNITAYCPWANGIAESLNKRILNILRKIVAAKQNDWDSCLPFLQMSLNSSYNTTIGDNPHYVVFLQDPIYPFEMTIEPENEPNTLHEYTAEMLERKRLVEQTVLENSDYEVEKYTDKFNEKTKPTKIIVGQRVYIKRRSNFPGRKDKLLPLYEGPFRVMKALENNRFDLQHLKIIKQ